MREHGLEVALAPITVAKVAQLTGGLRSRIPEQSQTDSSGQGLLFDV